MKLGTALIARDLFQSRQYLGLLCCHMYYYHILYDYECTDESLRWNRLEEMYCQESAVTKQ